jgi:hypothetical protein
MHPRRRCQTLALTVLASLASIIGAAAQDMPNYDGFNEGRFLRYLNAHEDDIDAVPRIGLSFGERTIRAVIDSGSTGIVVAARSIPNFDQLQSIGEGKLTYTSSGRVMRGQWVITRLALVGQRGARLETEPMPVLAVTNVDCLETARDCTPSSSPRNIAMVGVGFGREGDRQSQSTPDKNPLLQIAAGDGQRRQGYVLTRDGVHVGLTGANTRGDFRYVKLERRPDGRDWAGIPACISLNGQMPPACGSMLMDTGVSAMFMTVSPEQAGEMNRTLPDGTDVSVRVGTADNSSELYRFTVGDDSPLAPEGIHLRVSPTRAFVNTSYHLLNGFDLLYDADGGYAGFRQRR